MRTITAGLVMCLAVALARFATAQEDLEPLNTRVVEAYQRGDYDEAVELAEQAVRVAEGQFGEDAVETAVAINGLATIFNARSEFADVAPLLQRAITILEKSLSPCLRRLF